MGELENKLINTEKNYKNKLENKELEVIDIKALTRQEFTDQIAALRKENSTLKISNNDLLIRIESMEKNSPLVPSQKFDWEAERCKARKIGPVAQRLCARVNQRL